MQEGWGENKSGPSKLQSSSYTRVIFYENKGIASTRGLGIAYFKSQTGDDSVVRCWNYLSTNSRSLKNSRWSFQVQPAVPTKYVQQICNGSKQMYSDHLSKLQLETEYSEYTTYMRYQLVYHLLDYRWLYSCMQKSTWNAAVSHTTAHFMGWSQSGNFHRIL